MKINEKKLSRSTILAVTATLSMIIVVALVFVSLLIQKKPKKLENDANMSYSDIDNVENSLVEVSDENFSINEASHTFNETSYSENSVIEKTESEANNDDTVEIKHGWVINDLGYTYVYGDSGFEQFNYKNTSLKRYVNSLNSLAEVIPQSSRLFNITVPVSSTFAYIPREIYTEDNFYNQSQNSFVATVSAKLDERIINIPIVSIMEEKFDGEEKVYFRTDRNWTSLGAYYAYVEFCNQSGIKAYSLDSFESFEVGEFLGSFYHATNSKLMLDNPDEFLCYSTIPSVETSMSIFDSGMVYLDYSLCDNTVYKNNAYDIYLGRDAARYEICTNTKGETLLIIGDSSAYPLVPFLASHYSKIDIINPKRFDTSLTEFFTEHKYDDIISMCYSTNAVSGEYVPCLNIMTGAVSNE